MMNFKIMTRRDALIGSIIGSVGLLTLGACGKDPASKIIGKNLPDLNVQTLDGKNFNLGKLSKPAIIHFFGLWCPTCTADRPFWEEALKGLKKIEGLEIITIHVGIVPEKFQSLQKWNDDLDKDLKTPLIDDRNNKIFDAMQIPGTPSTLLVDSGGRIIDHHWDLKSHRAAKKLIFKSKELFGLEK